MSVFYFAITWCVTCPFSCLFDTSKPHWAKTPTPRINTAVQFLAVPNNTTADSVLQLELHTLNFNIGPLQSTSGAGPQPIASSSDNKRKFSAIGGSSHPLTSSCVPSYIHSGLGKQYQKTFSIALPIKLYLTPSTLWTKTKKRPPNRQAVLKVLKKKEVRESAYLCNEVAFIFSVDSLFDHV